MVKDKEGTSFELRNEGGTMYMVGTSYESSEPTTYTVVFADTPREAAEKTADGKLYSSNSITVREAGYILERYTKVLED